MGTKLTSIKDKPNLFFVTSPRSPYKMKDEVGVLVENFSGKEWNPTTQALYYETLAENEFFVGSTEGDLGFKARDRITRAPKALGIVDLAPTISLTPAGKEYIYGKRPHEAFTRQLLKFQFPSPYHTDADTTFSVRPYLELLRLVYEIKTLSKDEIAAFFMQLTHIDKYPSIKNKILDFRKKVEQIDKKKSNYKRFFDEKFTEEILSIYAQNIASGELKIRESSETSKTKFIKTKKGNHKDYADAAIRYLRETQLVSLRSSRSTRIYIPPEKKKEVEYILTSIPREPVHITDEKAYKEYLFNPTIPALFTDDKNLLVEAILEQKPTTTKGELTKLTISELKDVKHSILADRVEKEIGKQIKSLQLYEGYDDISMTYDSILKKEVIDAPVFMEWNTWRALTMLDDGEIKGNFGFDDTGLPLSTAPGNTADIICKYKDFDLIVEVTLSTGARQSFMESEPVPRHLGKHKEVNNKDTYGLFIAVSLNSATIAHFYALHSQKIKLYGGRAKIIPLSLTDFRKMLKAAYEQEEKPTAQTIHSFVKKASDLALASEDEEFWYQSVQTLAEQWM